MPSRSELHAHTVRAFDEAAICLESARISIRSLASALEVRTDSKRACANTIEVLLNVESQLSELREVVTTQYRRAAKRTHPVVDPF